MTKIIVTEPTPALAREKYTEFVKGVEGVPGAKCSYGTRSIEFGGLEILVKVNGDPHPSAEKSDPMDDLPMPARLEVVEFGPMDVIVLTVQSKISQDKADQLSGRLREKFPNNECVVVVAGELSVMRPTLVQVPND